MLNLKPDEPSAPSFRDKLNALWRRQSELSMRFDPRSEAEYQEVVRQIAELTSAQEAE